MPARRPVFSPNPRKSVLPSVAVPKGQPMVPPAAPLPTEQQMLKQFATKPVVKPPTPARVAKITKPLKSYL